MIIFNALQTSLSGGIGRYSYELARNLYVNEKVEMKIVIRYEDLQSFEFANKKDLIIVNNINNSIKRNVYEQFILPFKVIFKYPKAIIHYPDSMAPIFALNKVIITVHDLAFLTLKGVFTKKTVFWKKIITYLSVKKAKKIVAITNFTKSELSTHYPNIVGKTVVVYNGFNNFSNEEIKEENVSNMIIEMCRQEFILTVSTISPRKNIDGLIKAFSNICDKVKCNLIIAGGNGWLYEQVYELVETLNIKDRVYFAGKVNDEELKYLYSKAKIFTYISFYEGFGIPPLEAMSYNLPCLLSDRTAIPEVSGDNAIYVNPDKIDDISTNMYKMFTEDNLSYNSRELVKKYSWSKCAKETNEVYLSI